MEAREIKENLLKMHDTGLTNQDVAKMFEALVGIVNQFTDIDEDELSKAEHNVLAEIEEVVKNI